MSETKDPKAAATAAATAEPKLFACTVAPRRTVMKDGKKCGPGTILQFPKDEIARLRKLGFLTSPGVEEPEVITGDMPSVIRGG